MQRRQLQIVFVALAAVGLVVLLGIANVITLPGIPPILAPPQSSTPSAPIARWTDLGPGPSPSSHAGMMAYYPPAGGLLLLDAGPNCTGSYTWEFQHDSWTNLTAAIPAGPTPARGEGGMAYDAADGYAVMFGGRSACGTYNDTWTFANDTWTQVHPALSPPPLYRFAMTYDTSDGYVLLVGGCCIGNEVSRQTWAFAHGAWENLTQSTTPLVDLDSSLTYDASISEVVFVGGYASGYVSQATWIFHGGVWTRIFPVNSPSNRAGVGLAWDDYLGADVLLGGYTKISRGVYANLTDTWTYAPPHWTNLTSSLSVAPPYVGVPALMAYCQSTQQVVLFEGPGATWVFG